MINIRGYIMETFIVLPTTLVIFSLIYFNSISKVMVRCLLYNVIGVLLLLGFNTTIQAQSTQYRAQCGLSAAEGEAIKNRMLDNRRQRADLLATFERGRGNDSTVYVPIQFHIVRATDGSGGETVKDVLDNLCKLNEDYLHLNVEFYLAGPIRYINQDLLYEGSLVNGVDDYYMGLYKVDGVVNIFIGNNIDNGSAGGTTLGYYTPALDVMYAIRASVNRTATTLTHELGHFFSLPHTFNGWENLQYGTVMANTTGRTPSVTTAGVPVEVIIRSGGQENCQIAGDAFCDTDPNYLFGFYGSTYNNGCDFAGTATDPNGWMFRPEMIAAKPDRFKFGEDNANLTELRLRNLSTKDIIYPKTLIVVETQYTLGGNTVTMWQDTIGDSDSTDIYCAANADNDILETGALDVVPGFITTGSHTLDLNVTSAASSLSFIPAPAKYTITTSTGVHQIDMDSLRVTNTSSSATVPAGTVITLNDILLNNGTQVSTDSRTLSLPNALAPNQSYTFSAAALTHSSNTGIAGVTFNVNTFAPYQTVTGTTSDNVMSYYDDACATLFSTEQGDAMKMDIASRGFATLYSKPTDITITETATVISPLMGAVAPQPTINFQWNPVSGATIYHVHIYEINFLNQPLFGGEEYEFMVTGTNAWMAVEPDKRYGWRVYPLNATSFCTPNLGSVQANFQVYNWSVDVNKVEGEIESSKVYPNPSGKDQNVMLEIKSAVVGEAQISIYNSIGQDVMPAQTIELAKGDNVQKLNTNALSPGLYIINIETKNGRASHKLVIKE